MHSAEAALDSPSASETVGPGHKKRRNGDNALQAHSARSYPPTTDSDSSDVRMSSSPQPVPSQTDLDVDRPEHTGSLHEDENEPASVFASHGDYASCPSCGQPITDSETLAKVAAPLAEPISLRLTFLRRSEVSLPNNRFSVEEELQMLKAVVQDAIRVCNAVIRGDFTQRMTVQVLGIVPFQIKERINSLADKMSRIAKELTRVSREVGVEGKYGGQALVLDVDGSWRELIVYVNKLAARCSHEMTRDGREPRLLTRTGYATGRYVVRVVVHSEVPFSGYPDASLPVKTMSTHLFDLAHRLASPAHTPSLRCSVLWIHGRWGGIGVWKGEGTPRRLGW
ncbi:hypothetical protein AcV7_008414 [Taiwanofungus camphoratus]|nr:hypothetical protein AcV7_008414 [Antrodia cinnamomea]